jgi:hypothetical protein
MRSLTLLEPLHRQMQAGVPGIGSYAAANSEFRIYLHIQYRILLGALYTVRKVLSGWPAGSCFLCLDTCNLQVFKDGSAPGT